MKRREFITLVVGAAAWPLGATSETGADCLRAFRQALREAGHVEGENVTIIFRWAENQLDRLPSLAAELVQRRSRRWQVAIARSGTRAQSRHLSRAHGGGRHP